MKKLIFVKMFVIALLVLSFVIFTGNLNAQATLPVYEPFNYSVGNLSGNAGWAATGANTASVVQVVDTSLTYTNLPTSAGKKVAVLNGTSFEDPGFDITATGSQTVDSSVFASFILKVVNPGNTTGDYFFHFCSAGTASTDYHSRVHVKQGSGGATTYLMGLRNHNNDTIQFESVDRTAGTPIFVVVSYDFVTGTINDTSRIWVNPTLGESVPPTPLLTLTAVGTTNIDLASIGRINLRQGSGDTDTSLEVDELRVGTTWASVTPPQSSVKDWNLH